MADKWAQYAEPATTSDKWDKYAEAPAHVSTPEEVKAHFANFAPAQGSTDTSNWGIAKDVAKGAAKFLADPMGISHGSGLHVTGTDEKGEPMYGVGGPSTGPLAPRGEAEEFGATAASAPMMAEGVLGVGKALAAPTVTRVVKGAVRGALEKAEEGSGLTKVPAAAVRGAIKAYRDVPEPVGTPAARDVMQRVIRNQTASPSPSRAPSDAIPPAGPPPPPEAINPPFMPPEPSPVAGGKPAAIAQRVIRNQAPKPAEKPQPWPDYGMPPEPAPESAAPAAQATAQLWDDLAGGKGAYAKLGEAEQEHIRSIANRLDKGLQTESPQGPRPPRPQSYYRDSLSAPPPAPPVGSDYVMPQPADVAPPAFSQPEGFTSPGSRMPAMPEAHPKPPLVRGPGGQMQNPLQATGAAEQLKQSLGMPPEPIAPAETIPPSAGAKPSVGETIPPMPETAAPSAPSFESAFESPEGTPDLKPTKESVIKGHRTVKARAIARLLRDSNVSAEKAGTWKLGGPELAKAARSAGVNAPTSPESLAIMLDELRNMPARETPEFAKGGIVAPKKKSRGRFSRRGVWYGNPKDMPPAPKTDQSEMPPEPE